MYLLIPQSQGTENKKNATECKSYIQSMINQHSNVTTYQKFQDKYVGKFSEDAVEKILEDINGTFGHYLNHSEVLHIIYSVTRAIVMVKSDKPNGVLVSMEYIKF